MTHWATSAGCSDRKRFRNPLKGTPGNEHVRPFRALEPERISDDDFERWREDC